MEEHIAMRRTIGLLVPSLHLPWEEIQIGSIMDASEAEDLNLIIFPGGRLESEEQRESSRNVIYSLANANNLDGLIIWSSGLSELISEERLVEFIRSFEPLPVILAESRIQGFPSIFADSYTPLKELVFHIINDHKLSRIGFIAGERYHKMGHDRYMAYHDAMKEAGLPAKDEWVFKPVHSYDEEMEIKRIIRWYREFGKELEGVVVFNDLRARQFIRAMERIDVKIPDDIALCSYDDTANAVFFHPHLTTVRSPFKEMGTEAVKQLKAKMEGNEIPLERQFTGNGIIRESCGCTPETDEGSIRKVEKITGILGEKMQNLQIVNTMRAYLEASPSFWDNREAFTDVLTRFLIRAAIPTLKIYLYGDPLEGEAMEEDRILFEYFTFSKGVLHKPSETKFKADDLRHGPDKARRGRFTFVILPIFSRNTSFGLAIMEPGPRDGDLYETLMYMLGSYFEENRLLFTLNNQSESLKVMNEHLSTTIENLNTTRNMLVQSEKIAALSNLTGGIAHQINTPLGIAITAVSFLESCFSEYSESGDNDREVTAKILNSTLNKSLPMIAGNLKRVADLISTFKNIATENISGDKRPIVLEMFLKEQLASLKAVWNNRIEPSVRCSETLAVESFPGILSQILSLLVENSVKHYGEDEGIPSIDLSLKKEREKIIIEYRDDGPGIPEDVSGRIFDPFFSTKGGHKNPGLGLFIVHNLVTYKLHGSIELIKDKEKGVCFRMTLPESGRAGKIKG